MRACPVHLRTHVHAAQKIKTAFPPSRGFRQYRPMSIRSDGSGSQKD